jgi:hypothetical protein
MSSAPWSNETERADYYKKCSQQLESDIKKLTEERDAADKCINDIEIYLDLGSGRFAYRTIKSWRGRSE